MKHTTEFDANGEYICYWDGAGNSPSACVWMIPGTWRED
jgi:hypothetical protein